MALAGRPQYHAGAPTITGFAGMCRKKRSGGGAYDAAGGSVPHGHATQFALSHSPA